MTSARSHARSASVKSDSGHSRCFLVFAQPNTFYLRVISAGTALFGPLLIKTLAADNEHVSTFCLQSGSVTVICIFLCNVSHWLVVC